MGGRGFKMPIEEQLKMAQKRADAYAEMHEIAANQAAAARYEAARLRERAAVVAYLDAVAEDEARGGHEWFASILHRHLAAVLAGRHLERGECGEHRVAESGGPMETHTPKSLAEMVERQEVWSGAWQWFVQWPNGSVSGYVGSREEAMAIAREEYPELPDEEDDDV